MCSVARCFSTFACSDVGVFEDFYVEPELSGRGVARMLAQAAQEWCRANGVASLTVCSAPCDAEMYQALGFGMPLELLSRISVDEKTRRSSGRVRRVFICRFRKSPRRPVQYSSSKTASTAAETASQEKPRRASAWESFPRHSRVGSSS